MSSPALPELLAQVRAWASANYPGCPLEYITIHLRYLPVPIQLAEGPTVSTAAPPAEERGLGISPVVKGILRTLREVGRPLSRTRLLEEMGKRDMDWSERAVAGYLAKLMADGTIENPEDARPRGYRLTEEAAPTAAHGGRP